MICLPQPLDQSSCPWNYLFMALSAQNVGLVSTLNTFSSPTGYIILSHIFQGYYRGASVSSVQIKQK